MSHPSLSTTKIKEDNTIEQIQEKLKELTTRLIAANSLGNPSVYMQLQMVYDTYLEAQMEKLDEEFGKDGDEISDRINIL